MDRSWGAKSILIILMGTSSATRVISESGQIQRDLNSLDPSHRRGSRVPAGSCRSCSRCRRNCACNRNCSLRARLVYLRENWHRTDQLDSVLEVLYLEMDKLSKKAPADEATELATKRVNDVIQRGKELMKGVEFIDYIDPFVPAGDRPEHRDIVLVLSQLRQGIKRQQAELQELAQRSLSEKWDSLTANNKDVPDSTPDRLPIKYQDLLANVQ